MEANQVSRKRKAPLSITESKRPKPSEDYIPPTLCMLPDDVLLIILSYLPHISLLHLKKTCLLFNRLCDDYTLWRNVNIPSDPISREDSDKIASVVHKQTKYITMLGPYLWNEDIDESVTGEWMDTIRSKCVELEALKLPSHSIDCVSIPITSFPSTLTCLNLTHTLLRNLPEGRSYFRDISIEIPNLKSLILSYCSWFEPHSFMAISKCQHLEELIVNDCVRVKDCLAYCGLSTRTGFRALQTLDLRRCRITTSELVCFSSVPKLTNLYLENIREDGDYCPVDMDSAIASLCTRREWELHLLLDGEPEMRRRPYLKAEKLVVRHYQNLTDVSLMNLAADAQNLKYLDVTGSGHTLSTYRTFKRLRPEVFITDDNAAGDYVKEPFYERQIAAAIRARNNREHENAE